MVTEGFEIAQPLGPRAGRLLERAPDSFVELGPPGQQEVLIDDLVNEPVREAISSSLGPLTEGLDEIGLGEPRELRVDGARLGRDGAKERPVERRPEHGRFLEKPPRRHGQAVHPREEKSVERGWDDRLGHRGAAPAAPLALEHSSAHQAAYDLLDEERIAARPPGDEVLQRLQVRRRAEESRHQRARLVRGERGDTDDRLGGAGHEGRRRVGPVREQYHQRPVGQLIDYLAQEIDRGNVRPVAILDQEEQGFPFHAPLDQSPCGQHDLALELLGLDIGMHLALEPEHVAQDRRDGRRVSRLHLIGLSEEGAEDAVRRLPQRRACGAPDGRAGQASVGVESGGVARQKRMALAGEREIECTRQADSHGPAGFPRA